MENNVNENSNQPSIVMENDQLNNGNRDHLNQDQNSPTFKFFSSYFNTMKFMFKEIEVIHDLMEEMETYFGKEGNDLNGFSKQIKKISLNIDEIEDRILITEEMINSFNLNKSANDDLEKYILPKLEIFCKSFKKCLFEFIISLEEDMKNYNKYEFNYNVSNFLHFFLEFVIGRKEESFILFKEMLKT